MDSIQTIVNFLSLFFGGLIAGLLFSYSCSVNPGLKSLADSEYLKAMQAINTAIQNPYFLISFMSLLFILPITTFLIFNQQADASFYFMLAATIIYFVGVFGVTIFCNVPLNEQLAKISVSTATITEISTTRYSFEKPWNTYHSVRTIASSISFGLTILSIIKSNY